MRGADGEAGVAEGETGWAIGGCGAAHGDGARFGCADGGATHGDGAGFGGAIDGCGAPHGAGAEFCCAGGATAWGAGKKLGCGGGASDCPELGRDEGAEGATGAIELAAPGVPAGGTTQRLLWQTRPALQSASSMHLAEAAALAASIPRTTANMHNRRFDG